MYLPAGYTEQPNAFTRNHAIEAVWTYFARKDGVDRVLPDGRCDIILRFMVGDGMPISGIDVAIAGPSTSYHDVPIARGLGFVGVRLRPGCAQSVLGLDLSSIAGKVLRGEMAILAVPALGGLCATAESFEVLIGRLTAFVERQRAANYGRAPTPRALALLDALHIGGGRLSISDLARIHGIDERTVRRDVSSATGLGPKEFSRVVQFYRAVRLLRDFGLDPAAAAAEAGYSDQAHMTRAFRKLGGFAPGHLPDVTLVDLAL